MISSETNKKFLHKRRFEDGRPEMKFFLQKKLLDD